MVGGEAAHWLGDLATVHTHLTRTRDLFTEIDAPDVVRVQQALDSVKARRTTPLTS